MDRTYLQEAFHAMELLEEEDFRLDSVGVKDILDFKDHDELNDIVDVIDPEADTEEDLEDTYIGKVILECEVCHSPIFKNVEDIDINEEDSDVANIDEECPICHSNDGFKIIGQVCPYEEEPELKVEIEDKDFDGLDSDEDIDDDLEEGLFNRKVKSSGNPDTFGTAEKLKPEEKAAYDGMNHPRFSPGGEPFKEELDPELAEKLDDIEDKLEKVIDCVDIDSEEDIEDLESEDIEDLESEDTDEPLEEGILSGLASGITGAIGSGVKAAATSGALKGGLKGGIIGGAAGGLAGSAIANKAAEKNTSEALEEGQSFDNLVNTVGDVHKTRLNNRSSTINSIANAYGNIVGSGVDSVGKAVNTAVGKNSVLNGENTGKNAADIGNAALKLKSLGKGKGLSEECPTCDSEDDLAEGVVGGTLAGAALGAIAGHPIAGAVAGGAIGSGAFKNKNESCKNCDDEDQLTEARGRKRDLYSEVYNKLCSTGAGYSDYGHKPELSDFKHVEDLPDSCVGIKVSVNEPERLNYAKKVADKFKNDGVFFKDLRQSADNYGAYSGVVVIPMNESLHEGFEKIDLEMEDKIIHVSEEEKEPIPDAEMITPISPELEAELLNDEVEEEPFEEPIEEEPIETDEFSEDEPVDEFSDELVDENGPEYNNGFGEALNLKRAKTNVTESIDYDLNDFDEAAFNQLSEGYLKKVYENVDSFNTTCAKVNGQNLIVEGTIKFNSGKSKVTTFVFEACDATKDGKVRFIGENKQISRGKKSFTLNGLVTGNNFIAESLNYNYHQKTNEGISTRVYGTVKLNESVKSNELDEGILDKIKGGVNSARAKVNARQSSKGYASDNFAHGKNFSNSAAGYTRDAGYARAHDKYGKGDAAEEGAARNAVSRNYNSDMTQAANTFENKLTDYTNRLTSKLRQCVTDDEVDAMAADQWKVIRDRNSDDYDTIRELGVRFDDAVAARKKELKAGERSDGTAEPRYSTTFR